MLGTWIKDFLAKENRVWAFPVKSKQAQNEEPEKPDQTRLWPGREKTQHKI